MSGRRMRMLATGALLAAGMTGMAEAHVVLAPDMASPGSYYFGELRVGHGCGESPTVSIRAEIPEAVALARPQPKPGWTISIERKSLEKPVQQEGHMVSSRVSAITWTGGPLPADQFDTFGLLLKLPADTGVLVLPVIQTCQQGKNAWVDVPGGGRDWHQLQHPAVRLTIMNDDHDGMDGMDQHH